jgi:hypothetical protein
MIHQVPRLRTLPPVQFQHGFQKGAESLGRLHVPHILLRHNPFQRPGLQVSDVSQLALGVKQLPAVPAAHLQVHIKVAEELDNQRHMIVVLGKQVGLRLRVKQILRSEELEHDACDRPDIGGVRPVRASQNGFRRSILSCLDILGKVAFGWCRIAKICDFDRNWWGWSMIDLRLLI